MQKNPLSPIILKALKDKKFYEELKENPKKVIERELGISLPKEMKLQVLQETAEQKYLVLPYVDISGEIEDADLEKVSGGLTPLATAVFAGATIFVCEKD